MGYPGSLLPAGVFGTTVFCQEAPSSAGGGRSRERRWLLGDGTGGGGVDATARAAKTPTVRVSEHELSLFRKPKFFAHPKTLR